MPCVWTSGDSSEHEQDCILNFDCNFEQCQAWVSKPLLFTDVMPILRADVKELAGNRHADIEQLLQLLHEALSRRKGRQYHETVVPLWAYFKAWCTEHDLPFLPAAPLTVALHLLKLPQTAKSSSTIKLAIAAFHSFALQTGVPKVAIVAALREYARRTLPSDGNKKEPIPFDKVEEACWVLAERPPGRLRNLSLAAAISLGFCGFFRYDDLAQIRVGGITMSSDKASMEIIWSPIRMTSTGRAATFSCQYYACPVQLTAQLIQNAGLVDGSRPLFSAVSVHEGRKSMAATLYPTSL